MEAFHPEIIFISPTHSSIKSVRETSFVFFSRLHLEDLWHKVMKPQRLGLSQARLLSILLANVLLLPFNHRPSHCFSHLSNYHTSFRTHQSIDLKFMSKCDGFMHLPLLQWLKMQSQSWPPTLYARERGALSSALLQKRIKKRSLVSNPTCVVYI